MSNLGNSLLSNGRKGDFLSPGAHVLWSQISEAVRKCPNYIDDHRHNFLISRLPSYWTIPLASYVAAGTRMSSLSWCSTRRIALQDIVKQTVSHCPLWLRCRYHVGLPNLSALLSLRMRPSHYTPKLLLPTCCTGPSWWFRAISLVLFFQRVKKIDGYKLEWSVWW